MLKQTLFILILLVTTAFGQLVHKDHATTHPESSVNTCLECIDCHTCDNPTREAPCLTNCPRHSHHFYGQHTSGEGPDVVVIDQLKNHYGPVTFAHRLHSAMSEMTGGCNNCHHYSEKDGEIPSCRECHLEESDDISISMPSLKGAYHRQCINCHRDWANENACGFCHEPVDSEIPENLDATDIVGVPHPRIQATSSYNYVTSYEDGPIVTFHHDDHVTLFGGQCSDCHKGDSCSKCHDETKQTQQINHLTSCCSCHQERDCKFCHSTQPKPPFQHRLTTGWDLEPYHTKAACKTCHNNPGSFKTPSAHCNDCHIHWDSGSFNHEVTGLVLSEDHLDNDCVDCHSDRNFEVKPECSECHDEITYPEELPGESTR